MWTLLSDPLEKKYLAGATSRAFLISAACCLFAFIIPVLVLVSIGCTAVFSQIHGGALRWSPYSQISSTSIINCLACSQMELPSIIVASAINQPFPRGRHQSRLECKAAFCRFRLQLLAMYLPARFFSTLKSIYQLLPLWQYFL